MYKIWTHISDPIGNNEFHYNERIALWSKGEIFVTNIIQGNLDDLEEWSEIVFEEVIDNKLISCTWLKHFLQTEYKGIPTYIFDNHNHALFFRYQYTKQLRTPLIKREESADADGGFKPFTIIHIDQHADTKQNNEKLIMNNEKWKEIEDFVNKKTNVGNFISAALQNNIIDEIIQIRSEYALQLLWASSFKLWANYILDIDVDFREWKSEDEIESDSKIIQKLIENVCLITIATSPYFIHQKKAIEIVKKILQ